MSPLLVSFVLGLFTGTCAGAFVIGACVAAGRSFESEEGVSGRRVEDAPLLDDAPQAGGRELSFETRAPYSVEKHGIRDATAHPLDDGPHVSSIPFAVWSPKGDESHNLAHRARVSRREHTRKGAP